MQNCPECNNKGKEFRKFKQQCPNCGCTQIRTIVQCNKCKPTILDRLDDELGMIKIVGKPTWMLPPWKCC
jgi:hypothetical protein